MLLAEDLLTNSVSLISACSWCLVYDFTVISNAWKLHSCTKQIWNLVVLILSTQTASR